MCIVLERRLLVGLGTRMILCLDRRESYLYVSICVCVCVCTYITGCLDRSKYLDFGHVCVCVHASC
jgi:hypothetical protein